MEPVILKSNEFWGRRSGVVDYKKTGCPAFPQMQYGAGPSGAGKPIQTKLIGVPHKWFGRNYKSKRR